MKYNICYDNIAKKFFIESQSCQIDYIGEKVKIFNWNCENYFPVRRNKDIFTFDDLFEAQAFISVVKTDYRKYYNLTGVVTVESGVM
jgi:hypothetical protein